MRVVSRSRSVAAPMPESPRPADHRDVARSFLFVSSFAPEAAGLAVLASSVEPDLVRGLPAWEARAPLVVLDGLDVPGASVFTLNTARLMRSADDLERALPLR
jgi:hypothetical protein